MAKSLQNAILANESAGCSRIIMLTNGAFAKDVSLAAATYGIILWDRRKMKRFLTGKKTMPIPEDMDKIENLK